MDSNLWPLLIVAGVGFAVIGGIAMLSSNYTLGNQGENRWRRSARYCSLGY